jgi:hypothetical protein
MPILINGGSSEAGSQTCSNELLVRFPRLETNSGRERNLTTL